MLPTFGMQMRWIAVGNRRLPRGLTGHAPPPVPIGVLLASRTFDQLFKTRLAVRPIVAALLLFGQVEIEFLLKVRPKFSFHLVVDLFLGGRQLLIDLVLKLHEDMAAVLAGG